MRSVFLITGEVSGEGYGANLARELKSLYPDVSIYGIGGERMRTEGVELFGGITGAFGLTETLSHLRYLRRNLQKTREMLQKIRPSVVVLIDFPEFNLKVARFAREAGSKVLYYVAPQVWAWRSSRIKKLKKLCDKMALILPFEEPLFRQASIDAEFVGHPVMENIEDTRGSRSSLREAFGLEGQSKTIALLPGSRASELKRHLPLFEDVADRLKKRYEELQFVLPLAPGLKRDDYPAAFRSLEQTGVRILQNRATEAFMVSDTALVASGTATLQAALTGCPMVVVYKLFPLTYILGRLIVRGVKHISLVNILSGREVVKELIQGDATADKVVYEIVRTLEDENLRVFMKREFERIRSFYKGRKPSRRVALMVGELAGWQR